MPPYVQDIMHVVGHSMPRACKTTRVKARTVTKSAPLRARARIHATMALIYVVKRPRVQAHALAQNRQRYA